MEKTSENISQQANDHIDEKNPDVDPKTSDDSDKDKPEDSSESNKPSITSDVKTETLGVDDDLTKSNKLHGMLETYIETQFKEEEAENYRARSSPISDLIKDGIAIYVDGMTAQDLVDTAEGDSGDVTATATVRLASAMNMQARSKLFMSMTKGPGSKILTKDGVAIFKEGGSNDRMRTQVCTGQVKFTNKESVVIEFEFAKSSVLKEMSTTPGYYIIKYNNLVTKHRCMMLSKKFDGFLTPEYTKTKSPLFKAIVKYIETGNYDPPYSACDLPEQLSTSPLPSFARLNASQQQAVKQAYTCDMFSIIHGPPGTGKSECMAVLMEAMALQGKRVLVCAESNNPVDNLLTKFSSTEAFRQLDQNRKILRLGDKLRVSKDWLRLLLKRRLSNLIRNNKELLNTKYKDAADNINEIENRQGDDSFTSRDVLKAYLLMNNQFVFSTQCSIFDKVCFEAFLVKKFDYAIVDEASQSFSGQTLMAIAVSKRVIFAGDHKQLPPCIIDRDQPQLSESLFEMIMKNLEKSELKDSLYSMLNVQYRMNHELMQVSNKRFYDGKVTSDAKVADILLSDIAAGQSPILPSKTPLVWIDHRCIEEKPSKKDTINTGEADLVVKLIEDLQRKMHVRAADIGVIVSLKAQTRLIIDRLTKHPFLSAYVSNEGNSLTVATVDSFQGLEKEVIIYASVRSNAQGKIGFLQDERRFNVACTRAKRMLIFVGNSDCLIGPCPEGHFQAMFAAAMSIGKVIKYPFVDTLAIADGRPLTASKSDAAKSDGLDGSIAKMDDSNSQMCGDSCLDDDMF